MDAQRQEAFRQSNEIKNIELVQLSSIIEDYSRGAASTRIFIYTLPSSFVKYSVGNGLFKTSIMNMGTDRHQKFIDDGKVINYLSTVLHTFFKLLFQVCLLHSIWTNKSLKLLNFSL